LLGQPQRPVDIVEHAGCISHHDVVERSLDRGFVTGSSFSVNEMQVGIRRKKVKVLALDLEGIETSSQISPKRDRFDRFRFLSELALGRTKIAP
jgi:hypothetical protein